MPNRRTFLGSLAAIVAFPFDKVKALRAPSRSRDPIVYYSPAAAPPARFFINGIEVHTRSVDANGDVYEDGRHIGWQNPRL